MERRGETGCISSLSKVQYECVCPGQRESQCSDSEGPDHTAHTNKAADVFNGSTQSMFPRSTCEKDNAHGLFPPRNNPVLGSNKDCCFRKLYQATPPVTSHLLEHTRTPKRLSRIPSVCGSSSLIDVVEMIKCTPFISPGMTSTMYLRVKGLCCGFHGPLKPWERVFF